MRRFTVTMLIVALVAVVSVSAVGQQADLTLADAARNNNYPRFEELYAAAPPEAKAFAELQKFWKWSLEDRVGGFYGKEMHDRFARQYPGYAEYIADYAIVDSNNNTFYPSSETRRFLLQQAEKGISPRISEPVKVAKAPKAVKPAVVKRATPSPTIERAATPAPVRIVEALKPAIVIAPPPVADVVVPAAKPRRVEVPSSLPPPEKNFAPSIALVIAGLIGAGLLTLMLRTPAEHP